MNDSKLIKPASLLKEDFVSSLIDLCNNCGLPLFIIESILKDLIREVSEASKKQLEIDRENYNNALKRMQQET